MVAEEKLKELALFEEYKEAFECGSTNMDFKTWCWYRAATTIAATTLHLDRPNS